jgi:GNAT superfamily N-acetyltransferase
VQPDGDPHLRPHRPRPREAREGGETAGGHLKVSVQRVPDRKGLVEFIRFPVRLYRDCPQYVPPLEYERKLFFDPRKNPFFRHATVRLFLAKSGRGETLGRISAHVDRNYVRFHNEATGQFGFFDSVDDPDVARALFGAADGFLREQGMTSVIGPLNFTTNDELGVLVRGFEEPPFIMMNYNHPYYDRLIRECGYGKAKDLYAYYGEHGGKYPDFIRRMGDRILQAGRVTVRELDMKRFRQELRTVKSIYNAAWEKNWGFVPMTDEEIDHLAKNLKPLVDPSIIMFAYVDGKPAGLFIALPDYNLLLRGMGGKLFPFGFLKLLTGKRKIHRIRVMILGVVPEFRTMGIETVFLREVYRKSMARGYTGGEFSWVLEDNEAINRVIRRIQPEPYKVYRIYGKALGA